MNPNVYRSTQILSESPAGRVVQLYLGAIRFCRATVAALEAGHQETAHHASLRAQDIVVGLRESLNLEAGPLAGQLDGIYAIMLTELARANVTKNAVPVRAVESLLLDLLPAWQTTVAASSGTVPTVVPSFNLLSARR